MDNNAINSDIKINMQQHQPQQQCDYFFKIVLVGDSSVGKTSLIRRFCEYQFSNQFYTIGVDFKVRVVEMQGELVKLQIWDLAGAERFRSITASYYRRAHGVILNFDVSNRSSFERISDWKKEVDQLAPENTIKYLVGNKIDLTDKRLVSYEEAKTLAETLGMQYFETSAKDDRNVENTFMSQALEMKIKIGKDSQFIKPPLQKQSNQTCYLC